MVETDVDSTGGDTGTASDDRYLSTLDKSVKNCGEPSRYKQRAKGEYEPIHHVARFIIVLITHTPGVAVYYLTAIYVESGPDKAQAMRV